MYPPYCVSVRNKVVFKNPSLTSSLLHPTAPAPQTQPTHQTPSAFLPSSSSAIRHLRKPTNRRFPMPPPARSLRAPLHGNASTITLVACRPASQWGPSTAIERRQRPPPPPTSLAPARHLSTATRPPRAAPLPTTARKSLTTLREPATPPNPLPELALFTSYPPLRSTEPGTAPSSDHKPPDERKVKLGKSTPPPSHPHLA